MFFHNQSREGSSQCAKLPSVELAIRPAFRNGICIRSSTVASSALLHRRCLQSWRDAGFVAGSGPQASCATGRASWSCEVVLRLARGLPLHLILGHFYPVSKFLASKLFFRLFEGLIDDIPELLLIQVATQFIKLLLHLRDVHKA